MTDRQSETDRLFRMGLEVSGIIQEKLLSTKISLKEDFAKILHVFFFVKSYKTCQAIALLWQSGYPQDCSILARTIFEMLLQSKFVERDPELSSVLFERFAHVDLYRIYNRIREVDKETSEQLIEDYEGTLEDMKRLHNQYKSLFDNKSDWFGKSIYDLANELGMKGEYTIIYNYLSRFVHTSQMSLHHYIEFKEGAIKIKPDPDFIDDNKVIREATRSFLRIADLVNLSHQMNLGNKIKEYLSQIENMDKREMEETIKKRLT